MKINDKVTLKNSQKFSEDKWTNTKVLGTVTAILDNPVLDLIKVEFENGEKAVLNVDKVVRVPYANLIENSESPCIFCGNTKFYINYNGWEECTNCKGV